MASPEEFKRSGILPALVEIPARVAELATPIARGAKESWENMSAAERGALIGAGLGATSRNKSDSALGGAVIGAAFGKGFEFSQRARENSKEKAANMIDRSSMLSETSRRFEILKQAGGFDPMMASRTGGFLAKGVEGTLGTAKAEGGKRLGQKALDVMGAAAGQAAKAAPNMMGALKNKAVDIYKAVKGSSGSLADLAMELYGNGDIREDVMAQALSQAAGVKMASQMNQILKLAFLRSTYFGAESPTAALMASKTAADDKGPWGAAAQGAGQAVGGGVVSALLRAGEAGVRWLTDKTPQHVEESYKTMLKANPDFEHKQDVVRGHFDVLKTYAPSLAKNPLAAAGHIRQAMEMGQMIPVDTINKLVQTEKLHQEAGVHPSIFGK